LPENSGDCAENAKDGPKEEAKGQDLEENCGECEEIEEKHAKEGEQEAKRQESLKENSGEHEKVDEEHTKEGEQHKDEAEKQEYLPENSGDCEENANDGSKEEAKILDLEENSEEGDEEHAKEGEQDYNEAERQEDFEESSEGISEDTKVKTVEGSLSPDDLEKSTFVPQPDEIEHEQTEHNETSDQISAAPGQRSPRIAANPTKAVPAVPHKSQNSKLTAITLRKQLQHRQHDEKEAQADHEHAALESAESLEFWDL